MLLYPFMAVTWLIIGVGLLLLPVINDSYLAGMDRDTRIWMGAFALVLACYNIIRWRYTRIGRQLDQDAQAYRPADRPQRREEPPNPDFDFSDRHDRRSDTPDEPG